MNDLCVVLGVPAPDPATGNAERDRYVFEKPILVSGEAGRTTRFIDLYKRDCFVLEAKQGSESSTGKLGTAKRDTPAWNVAMNAAFGQAIGYATALDKPPPFIIITDIGYCFDVYASFDGTTRYRPFPNALGHRFYLTRLAERIETLRGIFLDPLSLDPSKIAVEVTREVAVHLADLTRRLEKAGHPPDGVADFLMRCIFTMFAEDVGLLPDEMFTKALRERWIDHPNVFPSDVETLWRAMNAGTAFGFFGKLLHFNGGLFRNPAALPLQKKDLQVLLTAASCRWNKVEPAIFGTLFEGALHQKERHHLGAHFTPRAYVESLVGPTIEEPLREDWENTQKRVRGFASSNRIREAKAETRAFMRRLSEVRVLDPACGSGNFLYVALDLLKAIEDESFALLLALEGGQTELCLDAPEVTPKQFMGIEINPRAKAIAELVLWIGYLQWHFRTRHRGGKPREPVLEDYKNIECRDALLAYDSEELVRDVRTGRPATRWDGETMKIHSVTREPVPDDRFTVPTFEYVNSRRAEWPVADFIVGNPPFLGNKRMRAVLGDGYVQALRGAWADVPEASDLVMYWWHIAANTVRRGDAKRFGLITTNSITQTYNARVVEQHLDGTPRGSIVFAIPDHPWVDLQTGAAVRIAMTVGQSGTDAIGLLCKVVSENQTEEGVPSVAVEQTLGRIHHDLTIGVEMKTSRRLRACAGLSGQGVLVLGDGFLLTEDEAIRLRQVEPRSAPFIRPFRNGRDLMGRSRALYIIDLFGLTENDVRGLPHVYQRLWDQVRPFRLQMRDKARRERWWLFGRSNAEIRAALRGLQRYIATCRTAKHRVFMFLPGDVLPDTKLVAIGLDDGFDLAILSSKLHAVWSLRVGGFLEDRPTYQHADCFSKFPYPLVQKTERKRIQALGDSLDAHRKSCKERHADLTITDMYNVLEKVRRDEELDDHERQVHEQGLVSILKKIHDDVDAAVFAAYGWPMDLTDEQILERLVALNAERAIEEERGLVRWLRPEFQADLTVALEPQEDERAPGIAKTKAPKGPGVAAVRLSMTGKKKSRRAVRR